MQDSFSFSTSAQTYELFTYDICLLSGPLLNFFFLSVLFSFCTSLLVSFSFSYISVTLPLSRSILSLLLSFYIGITTYFFLYVCFNSIYIPLSLHLCLSLLVYLSLCASLSLSLSFFVQTWTGLIN